MGQFFFAFVFNLHFKQKKCKKNKNNNYITFEGSQRGQNRPDSSSRVKFDETCIYSTRANRLSRGVIGMKITSLFTSVIKSLLQLTNQPNSVHINFTHSTDTQTITTTVVLYIINF